MTTHKKQYEQWLQPGIYNGLQRVLIPAFGVVSTMFLARKLSTGDMGIWALFLAVTAFVEMIRETLVKSALIRYYNSHGANDHKQILSAAFFLNAIITVVLCLVLLFAGAIIANALKVPGLTPMLHIFIAGMLVLIPFSHFEWMIHANFLYKSLFFIYLVRQGVTLLLIVGLYYLLGEITAIHLVISYCIGIFCGTITGFFSVRHLLALKMVVSVHWIKQFWHFGKYVFGAGLSTLAFRNADQFMVSNILANASYVASQSIAMRIINLADIPSQVLGDILFLKNSKESSQHNPAAAKRNYEKAVAASLCFILPVVLTIIVFPKLILLIVAGNKYITAAPFLQAIAVSAIFLAFLKQYGVLIDSSGMPRLNFFTITAIACIHIASCWFFIHQFGFLGAAYALLCTHGVAFIITQTILKKRFDVNWMNCFKNAWAFYPELYKMIQAKLFLKSTAR